MISDTDARRIASEWHGGGGTALYAFSSTGTILDDAFHRAGAIQEIDCDIRMDDQQPLTASDETDLDNLRAYIATSGPRGPQEGWTTLSW